MTQKNGQQALLAQHALVMLGFLMPGGEVLGSWLGMKFGPPEDIEAKDLMRKNWAFQTSWFILRFLVIFATAGLVWATAARDKLQSQAAPPEVEAINEQSVDINIPGEPTVVEDEDGMTAEEQRESMRSFRASIMGDRGFIEWTSKSFHQEATLVFRLLIAFVVAICMWMTSMLISLINLARVAQGKPGFYPLILPWLKKKKAS